MEEPWLVICDFNAILSAYDKYANKEIGNSNDAMFIRFINHQGVINSKFISN